MYTKFKKMNSSGFTLVEIIASIAILGMVIAMLLPIFPQIMSWTKDTEEELVASNLLSEVASDAKKMEAVELLDADIDGCKNYLLKKEIFFKDYSLNGEKYEAKLIMCKENNVDLYRTNIRIYSANRLVSESYTYISGDSNE